MEGTLKVLFLAWFLAIPQFIQEISDLEESRDALLSVQNPVYLQNTTDEYDYVIVGAGSAGAVVANLLSKHPNLRVLIIQDGGNPSPFVDVAGLSEQVKNHPSTDYAYKAVKQRCACLRANGCTINRGKGLGGSSNLYGMVVVRGNSRDYNLWGSLTNDSSWDFKNVLKIFKRQEDYHGSYQHPSKFHGQGGPSYVSAQKSLIFKYVSDASRELGLSLMDPNANLSMGYAHLDVNVKRGIRWGSYQAFLKPILGRKNLEIYRYAQATKIHFSTTMRATGVFYVRHGVQRFVKARKEVIVCAGAFDTPKLLMLSGLGPEKSLKRVGIRPLLNLPVGRNLQDHVGISLIFDTDRRDLGFILGRDFSSRDILAYLINGTGPLGTVTMNSRALAYITSSEVNDQEWPDLEVLIGDDYHSNINDRTDSISFAVILIRPLSRGKVTLGSNDPKDPPLIDPKYLSHPSDIKRLVEGVEFILTLAETTTAFRSINKTLRIPNIPDCTNSTFRSREYWECVIRHQSASVFHPVGTVKMGAGDDPTAVVDSKLRVIGTTGLRVVDASIMPVIPTGHTHTPSLMIGEMGARFILGELQTNKVTKFHLFEH